MPHNVYIGLGSNKGDHRANLMSALRMLHEPPRVEVVRVSRLLHTRPIGPPQGMYLNGAARLLTMLEPLSVLHRLHEVEAALGRDRSREQRWGPRTCDLDLLLYDDLTMKTDELIVPHPRMHERLFVLRPLAEIAPFVVHPVLDKTILQLKRELEA